MSSKVIATVQKTIDKDTDHGRAIRTAVQVALGIISFIAGILVIPGLGQWFADNQVVGLSTFATWVGVVAYVQNKLEALKKYLDEKYGEA